MSLYALHISLADQERVEFARLAAERFPRFEYEAGSGFPASPGRVQDDEILYRLVFSPHHWDEKAKEPKPQAFDDAFTRGMSVQRNAGVSEEQAQAMGEAVQVARRVQGKEHTFVLCAQSEAGANFNTPKHDLPA